MHFTMRPLSNFTPTHRDDGMEVRVSSSPVITQFSYGTSEVDENLPILFFGWADAIQFKVGVAMCL